ncbi:MAG: hypothetical protein ABI776_10365 [Nocardioidaceae bacterium]
MNASSVQGPAVLGALVLANLGLRRIQRVGRALAGRMLHRPHEPLSLRGRPIEEIACDVRRLGVRVRYAPAGASFVRVEGGRRAYDRVLGEACASLGVEHLLGVLPPGPELDGERGRVEAALERAGLRLDPAI